MKPKDGDARLHRDPVGNQVKSGNYPAQAWRHRYYDSMLLAV